MKYKIILEEIVSGCFEIEANSPQQAFNIACKKYKNSEIVNEPGNIEQVQIAALDKGKIIRNFEKV